MNCVRGLSNSLHRRLIHRLFIRVCPLSISEGCLQNKTNTFVWEQFSYMAQACVRESVRTRGM